MLLYELLTGTVPFDFKGKSPREAIDIITHSSPPPASFRVKNSQIASKLRGDLDDILQKALRKKPADRYPSAGDLLSDIRKYRQSLPLSFKRDQRSYLIKKFAVRNSRILSGAFIILFLLTGLSIYYLSTITSERQRAIEKEQQAMFIAGFMVDLFDASDPLHNISDTLTVYDILQEGVDKLDDWAASERTKADIMISLGNAYKKIGDFEQSQSLLENALDIYVSELADSTAPDMMKPALELAALHNVQRSYQTSAHHYDYALSIKDINRITDPYTLADLYSGYGNTMSELDNPQLGILFLENALSIIRSENLSDSYTRTTKMNLAKAYRSNGEYQKSEALYKELLKILPAEDPNTPERSLVHNNLGYLLKVQDKLEEASVHYNRSLEINQFIYGQKHPNTKIILNNLSALYSTNGQFNLAEDIRLDLLEMTREEFGETHWRTGASYEALGILKIQSGDLDPSAGFFEKAIEIYTESLGEDHIWTERAMLYFSLSRFNSVESQLAKSQFLEAFQSLKEKRIAFSRYDVEVMNNLINNFKPYPSISSSSDFARLEEIK